MPRKRGTKLVAKRLLDTAAEDNSQDYFGKSTARKRRNDDNNGQDPPSKVPREQLDDRTARRVRRAADKLSQTQQARVEKVSPRRRNAQPSAEDDNEDGGGESAEEEDDDNGGADAVDHARITQAMNQARNRIQKPTINGIGSLQRKDQPQRTESSEDDGEDDQEDLLLSQSPERDNASAPRSTIGRSRGKRGAYSKAPEQQKQRSHKGRGRPSQKNNTSTFPPDEDESEAESSTETNDQFAEDTAFVGAPQPGEKTETVKVVINSMGGIFKTLQHPAWTGLTQWAREFESDGNDDGQKTCKTRSGKGLMDELQGLNTILEQATDSWEEQSGDDDDFTSTAIAYLRTKSVDVQRHLARIDKIIDEICCRKLLPAPRTGNPGSIAQSVRRRRTLLQDLSRRLIPMLMVTVKKACGICPSEDNRSRTTLHVDCFRLQFFLRPLAWADRLHKALERSLRQGSGDEESQTDANDPGPGGSNARDSKKKARAAFGSQLDALYSACRKAEREIQDKAAQAERQEREEETKRQNRERQAERQREIEAEIKRKENEQRRIDERKVKAFIEATHALRSRPDPLKELWDQSQAALPEHLRATSTVTAAQRGRSAGHSQSTAEAAHPQGGPSGNAGVEPVYQSDDPFLDNYRPRPEIRAWSEVEDRAMIRAIRYKRNYDVVSMAQKLRRSEDDVARMAACLKRAYREAYTQKGVDIPAWAL